RNSVRVRSLQTVPRTRLAECAPWCFLDSRSQRTTPCHVGITALIQTSTPPELSAPAFSRLGWFVSRYGLLTTLGALFGAAEGVPFQTARELHGEKSRGALLAGQLRPSFNFAQDRLRPYLSSADAYAGAHPDNFC